MRRPATVGNGTDYSAQTSGDVPMAEGSFVSVSGVTSENDTAIGTNQWSLQLNTEFFPTTACSGGQSGCQGWEQFVFSNRGPITQFFIQYWLVGYGSTCPPPPNPPASGGWNSYDGVDCFINSQISISVPVQTPATLGDLTVTGVAPSGSTDDSATLSIGSQLYSIAGSDYLPDLGQHWNASEFNVLGAGNGSEAVFNAGSTIVVRTAMDTGGTAAPSCVSEGFTAETNNLTLVGTPAAESGAVWPSIIFTESNAGNPTAATCSATSGATGGASVSATATTIYSGNSTTLTVTPAGSGPFTYQWYVGVSGNTSSPISGATGAGLTVAPGATTSYWVLITAPGGQLQSSETITISVEQDGSGVPLPLPLWALVALGAALYALGRRNLTNQG